MACRILGPHNSKTNSSTLTHSHPDPNPDSHNPNPDPNPDPDPYPDSETLQTLNLDLLGKPLSYSTAKSGPDRLLWTIAEAEEFFRLITTGTLLPIAHHDIPGDRLRDVVYYNPVVKQKRNDDGTIKYRVRGTAGGNLLDVPYDVSARTASLDVVKLLLHSTVSDKKKWFTIDIKDFYLGTPLPETRYEYIRIERKKLPPDSIAAHNLEPLFYNDAVYFQIRKCMYGLPQAGRLSQLRLISHLAKHGYHQSPNTPCLFQHETLDVTFCLVVDDFGVRYGTQSDADHLVATLRANDYELTINDTGDTYLGMHISFGPDRVSLSMPGYINKALQRFRPQYLLPTHRAATTPGKYHAAIYPRIQLVKKDNSPLLSPTQRMEIQAIVGTLLYYARAVDPSLLPIANEIASQQANPTQKVMTAANRALSYASARRDNCITYYACDMHLFLHVDASYLSRSHARSVVGGYFFLGNENQPLNINGATHVFSSIIPCIVSSAGEAEYAALFAGAQHAASLRNILSDLGYPQPPTIIMCDNTCAIGIATDSIKQKRSKAIDMRFHWVRDRVRQGQFTIAYIKSADNIADYFTKNLDPLKHKFFMQFLAPTHKL
jgi:hypothetical protein